MATAKSSDNTILALFPPHAPDATTPVVGAVYGVPKHVYDLKPMGLTIVVDPPQSGTLQEGDVIRLRLNGADTEATKTVLAGEENSRHTLYLPKGLLLTDRVNTLVYTITRISENQGTSTPELTLLYNTIRPGIEDRSPGDSAHSELQLILPQDVLDDGIDADRAKQGVQVCFAYPYCRAYDQIRLNCNGQDVAHTVTAAEAPPIPSAEPTRVCVMVEEAVFLRAGDNPKFIFSYTVTDQLGNGPDTDSPYSGTVEVDVNLKETRLVAPDLAEDPDDPTDDPSTIDLDKLAGKDLTVLVHTFAPLWQPNDRIRVTYTASSPNETVVSHTVEAEVGRIPFTYKLMVPNAKVIAGSVVRAKYELLRNGNVFATSKNAVAEVTGSEVIELLPPVLLKPAVSPIDALAYPQGVTIRVEYLGALPGDKARLVEVNPPAGAPQFPLVPFNNNKRTNTVLSLAFLTARHGKEIRLRWNLNRDNAQKGKSPDLNLSVSKINEGDTRLPTPVIDGKTGNELDVALLQPTAQLTVATWPHVEGERLWLQYEGKDNQDQTVTFDDLRGEVGVGASGLSRAVPLDWLKDLKDGSELKVTLKVNFDGVANAATAVGFPVRRYSVRTVKQVDPTIISVKGHSASGPEIPDGATTTATTLMLTGKGTANQAITLRDNGIAIVTFDVNPQGDWSRTLTDQDIGDHRYTVRSADGSTPESSARTLTLSHMTDFQDSTYNGWDLYTGARSGSIRVHAGERAFFNFTDVAPSTGYSGAIFYQDFVLAPGTYTFTMKACHIREFPNTNLVNPILALTTSLPNSPQVVRELPKNGTKYDFSLTFTVAARQSVRLYIVNHQDNGIGNDFGIFTIGLSKGSTNVNGAMETLNELPPYTGALQTIALPQPSGVASDSGQS
ncbi:hypothetical protein [Pseudomonas monsensis]|uniref:hypothetical protein n=1 Tax=Pseudomonas monsensis TaxID=2745509 RepID=UPI00300F1552